MIGTAQPGSRGFTLIELLIALTLLGLLTVVLFGGLRFGTRTWEAGSARAERLAEVEAVQGLLRRQIAQAHPPAGRARTSESGEDSFVGEEEALRFTAPVPSHIGVGGLYRFRISLTEDVGTRRLELAWQIDRPDAPAFSDEAEPPLGGRRVLIEGLQGAAFRYYGAGRDGDEPDWHDEWDGARGLPALIALSVDFPPGDPRAWPELFVAPRLTATTRAR